MRYLPLLLLLSVAGCHRAADAPQAACPFSFQYMSEDHVRRANDDREIDLSIASDTVFDVHTPQTVDFSYKEQVYGATTPIVKAVKFPNSRNVVADGADMKALEKALIDAGILTLKSDDAPAGGSYSASFFGNINDKDISLSFNSHETGARARVRGVIMDFARRIKIDQPSDFNAVTTVSEGDLQPARQVTVEDLLKNPDAYNGKRVSVTGYYNGRFEGQVFCLDKNSVLSHRYEYCIYRHGASSFVSDADAEIANDTWERADGVFFKGPAGHMGLWPGELVRLTRVELLPPPPIPHAQALCGDEHC